MVLPVLRVVVVGPREIRTNDDDQAVRYAVRLRVVPEVVDRVREIADQPPEVRVVGYVGIETAKEYVRADGGTGLEREHRNLRLSA